MTKYTTLFFSLIIWQLIGCQKPTSTIDQVIINANYFDGNHYHEGPFDILIKANKIVEVQPSSAQEYPEGTSIIDAQDQFVMPGLIEGHGHFLSYGEGLSQLELSGYKNWDEIIAAVEEQAETLPEGTWIEGRGWHQEKWDKTPNDNVQGYPIHDELSARVPGHPVYLNHASGHAGFANQAAMDLVGITIESPSPQGGRILKGPTGQPTGVFEENATQVFEQAIVKNKDLNQVWERALTLAAQSCIENGVTSFQDAGSSVDQIKWFHSKAEAMELPLRLYLMAIDSLQKLKTNMSEVRLVNAGDSFLTCRAVKNYFDGALGSRGAWLLEEYADQPGYFGQNTMLVSELEAYAEICTANDLQFCVHAIGDRANRATLDLFEQVAGKASPARWRIEHAQHIDPADQPRFEALGVIASMQPIHCTSDAPYVIARLGVDRAEEGAYVWRNLIDLGAHLAVGTDVPVEPIDPFANIYSAVTRKRDHQSPPFFENQRISREEILYLYTSGNAYAAFEEAYKGKIAPGYVADICILDRNLMTCPADSIPHTQVIQTMINGNIVYTNDAL